MESFLAWFFAFITKMFGGLWEGVSKLFLGVVRIFDFGTYFDLLTQNKNGFGVIGWVLTIIAFILVYAFWAAIAYLIVLFIKRRRAARKTLRQNEDLLDEIAQLHFDMDKLMREKERILEMKVAPGLDFNEIQKKIEASNEVKENAESGEEEEDSQASQSRFYRLTSVDAKYSMYVPPVYRDDIDLLGICEELRNFACSRGHLYYEPKTIRLMIAGLASTKMVLLQGISGTGKTSLPYIMGKFFENDSSIASVQPSWRDRAELFGYFNEFTKKFNETEVLCRIYESSFNDDINFIILDELNIARVEYYFAEMLSILEMPDPNEWKIQLVPSVWRNDPIHLQNGKLSIPQNIWYIGTANNDDSTFSISDKVYDRAFVINLDSKGTPFDAPDTPARRVSYQHLDELYKEAIAELPVTEELLKKIEKLDNFVIEHFRVAFGNRIMKQLGLFVPCYIKCGGSEEEAVDYILATKVFRKFESLNLALIRDEIKGLINQLDVLFGKDVMKECIDYLKRLQRSY